MQLVLPYHNFIQEEMNRNEISLFHFQYHIKVFTAFPNIFHLDFPKPPYNFTTLVLNFRKYIGFGSLHYLPCTATEFCCKSSCYFLLPFEQLIFKTSFILKKLL